MMALRRLFLLCFTLSMGPLFTRSAIPRFVINRILDVFLPKNKDNLPKEIVRNALCRTGIILISDCLNYANLRPELATYKKLLHKNSPRKFALLKEAIEYIEVLEKEIHQKTGIKAHYHIHECRGLGAFASSPGIFSALFKTFHISIDEGLLYLITKKPSKKALLKAALLHEAGHLHHKHGLKDDLMSLFMITARTVSGHVFSTWGDSQLKPLRDEAKKGSLDEDIHEQIKSLEKKFTEYSIVLGSLFDVLESACWRMGEFQADDFAARHGHGDGLIEYFEEHATSKNHPSIDKQYLYAALDTHPPIKNRIERLLKYKNKKNRPLWTDSACWKWW